MAEPFGGIYVHVPFCAGRCNYCDFATAPYDAAAARRFLAALSRELDAAALTVGPTRADTLYVGGGTPPVLGPQTLGKLIRDVSNRFAVAENAEVTVEANPETLSAAVLDALAANGVNRLSLGAQTFDDNALKLLGRRHDAARTEEAYWRARKEGFENISLDLIYGLPGQTAAGWRRDVDHALALKPNHISLYALTLEPGTKLYQERGDYYFPADDDLATFYFDAVDTLTASRFIHYEISNFARPGFECRHNLKYWRDRDYLAFGPGAASHWRRGRYRNPRPLDAYVAAAAVGRWPLAAAEPSDAYREMRTAATLGLRLTEGIDAAAFERRFGVNPKNYYERELAELTAAGVITVAGDNIKLSRRGLFLSDEVFARLI